MGEQAIEHRADWSEDSRMLSTYSRVTDEQMNDVVFTHHGIEGDGDTDSEPSVRECDLCRETMRPDTSVCPPCGFPVDSSFDEEFESVLDTLRTLAVESDDSAEREQALNAEAKIREEPSIASRVHELLSDE